MASYLLGLFAYTVQGFMDARSVDLPNNYGPNNFPLQVNQGRYGNPIDPAFRQRPAAELLLLPGFYPSTTQPPNNGYYPFSEIGYMSFARDGSISGKRRVNTAGYPGQGSTFKGQYQFDNTDFFSPTSQGLP